MSTLAKIDFTFRIIVLLVAMTFGVLFIFAGARNALAANLKSTAVITGEVFTVGDIFGGLSRDVADKVLGPAPQPGQDMVLNARTLMRVAIALDLPWRPVSNADQVVIRRAATLISTDSIKDRLSADLRERGMDGRFDITFTNGSMPQIVVPQSEDATFDIRNINYDAKSGRFEAELAAPSLSRPLAEITVAGKAERLVALPVLKKTMAAGDIINAYSLEWIDLKESELQHDMVLSEDELVGMTPRRMVFSGKPVRESDLERPQLVGRGQSITITYNEGSMILTAKGKALQAGAKGDLIRVVNTSSNRTIDAFVEGDSIVTVSQE